MSERQTLRFLTQRFEQAGLRPKTKFGQNFLIDMNLLDLLARTAEVDERDVILEVGTGAGSLTTRLAPRAAHVVTIEIDSELAQVAMHQLREYENVTLLQMDALKNKNHLQDAIVEELARHVAAVPNGRLKLVANLPYNVATQSFPICLL